MTTYMSNGIDFWNSTLLLAVIGSWAPQMHRIIATGSTWGIAPNYLLFNRLFTASQLIAIPLLSSYPYPILEYIGSKTLMGLDAYKAVLGVIPIFIQWIGRLSLYKIYSQLPRQSRLTREH